MRRTWVQPGLAGVPGGETGPVRFPEAMRRDRRDREGMSSNGPDVGTMRLIDMCRALDLIATTVRQAGEDFGYPAARFSEAERSPCPYTARNGPRCLVGRALSLERIRDDDLEALRDHPVRELYAKARLPVRLTLGAMVVLDAAERARDRGATWCEAPDDAMSVAVRFVDLLPDRAFIAAISDRTTTDSARCVSSGSASRLQSS